MTYMSIIDQIKTYEALTPPTLQRIGQPKGEVAKRGILLAPQAQKDLDGAMKLVGRGYVIAVLERWVTGKIIKARIGGKKHGAFLAMLNPPPDQVWELRVTEPQSQGRLFCRFAAKDLMIVTHMNTRSMLGKDGSPNWKRAMDDCVKEWDRLFPGQPPYQAGSVADYISENWEDLNA